MSKKYLVIGLLFIFSILSLSYLFYTKSVNVESRQLQQTQQSSKAKNLQLQLSPSKPDQHDYLKYYGGEKSNIFIDCKQDQDCRLAQLVSVCGEFSSINANNTESEIEKYNKRQKELLKGIEVSCKFPPEITDFLALCKNYQCGFVKK